VFGPGICISISLLTIEEGRVKIAALLAAVMIAAPVYAAEPEYVPEPGDLPNDALTVTIETHANQPDVWFVEFISHVPEVSALSKS
jgi:hypothetical protein